MCKFKRINPQYTIYNYTFIFANFQGFYFNFEKIFIRKILFFQAPMPQDPNVRPFV